MRKIINSETVKFQDIITDNLVLDAKAKLGSFNSITSDAVARAVAGASGEVPEVTEDDNGKVLKAVYDKLGPGVEWSDADVDLTGGDGISVDNNTVAVKVGEGLNIANYRETEQIKNDYYVTAIEQGLGDSSYSLPYIVPMADVFEEINSTSSFHLNNSWFRASTDFNDPDPTPFYWAPAIVLKSEAETVNFTQPFSQIEVLSTTARQSTAHPMTGVPIIEGEADGEGVTIPISFDDINQDLSNFHFDPISQPQDPELYALTFVLVNSDCTSLISGDRLLGWSNDWEDFSGTFAYERTVIKRHALNVTNPVPSYSDSDAGKVLSVNSQGTGVEWVAETIPTVDQTYDATSANAQSGTAVSEAIAGVNQVPASTSADANKVLAVDAQGVPGWATPSGGGDGIKQIYPTSVATSSNDKSLKVLNCNAFGLKYPAESNLFSFRILTYEPFSTDSIPMYGMYNDKMYTHGARTITLATKWFYPFEGVYYAWFPCTGYLTGNLTPISKDIYLKSKTTNTFSNSNVNTYAYRTDGTKYTGSGSDAIKYRTSIKTPFSETPSLELFAEDFDLIGDWSTVSTLPKLEWTLAFMTSGGAWTRLNGEASENNSALAATIPAGLSLALQSNSGLELNPVTGLKVLNKLPSSASTDEGKVLTVDSQGAAAWSTLPSDVPAYSDADSGKVLQVQADGTLAWVTLP
jgi:hypothetical protein